jgi:hypothetical protein
MLLSEAKEPADGDFNGTAAGDPPGGSFGFERGSRKG